jgi:FdhD protein
MKRLAAAHKRVAVRRWQAGEIAQQQDWVAAEAPLELRLIVGGQSYPYTITMRTPGADFELAAGFLFSEGLVAQPEEIASLRYCLPPGDPQQGNVLSVTLRREVAPLLGRRGGLIASSCGVCGTVSLKLLEGRLAPVSAALALDPEVIVALPEQLRRHQRLFQETGGVHAAGRCDNLGALKAVWEDVGRHNALDKLIGDALLNHQLPLSNTILMLSGRASFELVHKAIAAGIAVVCAVSAPSSLAIELAERFGVTLVGFVRGEQFTVYSHPERLAC